jgi:hypothetical protein
MKLLAGVLALSSLTLPSAVLSQDGDPHEHGVGRLQIRVDADRLALRLRVPLQTLLGTEATPRGAKQRQVVRKMAATLRQAQTLFIPTPEADCWPTLVSLASDAIAPELLSFGVTAPPAQVVAISAPPAEVVAISAPPAAARKPARQAHADLDADIAFQCAKPQLLTGLQVRMFAAFPELRQLDVGIVTPRGDSGARLSANRASLTW